MLKNLITKLSPEKQVSLMSSFNKAAIITNYTATGYMVGAPLMGVVAGIMLTLKNKIYPIPNRSLDKSIHNMGDVPIGFLKDHNITLYQKSLLLKEKMQISADITFVILEECPTPMVSYLEEDKYWIGLPQDFLKTKELTENEKLAAIAHELAHIARKDSKNHYSTAKTTRLINFLNIVHGAVSSIGSLNPIPLASGLIGRKINQIFLANENKIAEINADSQAGKYTKNQDIMNMLQSISSPNAALSEAVYNMEKESEIGVLNLIFEDLGLGKAYQKFKRNIHTLTKTAYPSLYQRISLIETAIRKEDPTYKSSPLYMDQKIEICRGCTDIHSEEDEQNIKRHLKNAFNKNFGHTDFTVRFTEDCSPPENDTEDFIRAMFSQLANNNGPSMPQDTEIVIITPRGPLIISTGDLPRSNPPIYPQ